MVNIEGSLSADLIAQQNFPPARRGFDPEEVRSFLVKVAAEIMALHERQAALEVARRDAEYRAAHPSFDEETLLGAVGEETAQILRSAHEAAADIKARAEENASRILKDAHLQAEGSIAEAETVLARRTEEAEGVAGRIKETARVEAGRLIDQARQQAKAIRAQAEAERNAMIEGAQATREKILTNLTRKRNVAVAQVEQLRAGRERLLQAYEVVRRTLEEATSDLTRAEVEARAAADAVRHRPLTLEEPDGLDEEPEATNPTLPIVQKWRRPVAPAQGAPPPPPRTEPPPSEGPAAAFLETFSATSDHGPPKRVTEEEVDSEAVSAPTDGQISPATEQAATSETAVTEVGPEGAAGESEAATDASAGPEEAATRAATAGSRIDAAAGGAPSDASVDRDGAGADGPTTNGSRPPDGAATEAQADAAHSQKAGATEGAERSADLESGVRDAPPEDSGLPVTAAPEAPVATEGAIPPEPPAPTTTTEDSRSPAAGDAVESLFARIRADREQAVSRAHEVLAHEPSVADANEAPVADADEAPVADADEALLQRRDRAVESIEANLTRRLKRALQDDQNDLLDRLRSLRPSQRAADVVLPAVDAHTAPFREASRPFLREALAAGSAFMASLVPGVKATDSLTAAAERAADALATAIVDPLRRRLGEVLAAGDGDDPVVLAEAVGAAYREWKTKRVEVAASDHVAAAFADGAYAVTPAGIALRWLVCDLDGPCPDCDDNALAGEQPKGEPFPTGQPHPPAHPGCRCVLIARPH